MRVVGKVVVGCLASTIGFVAFGLVFAVLAVMTMAFISTPDDRTAGIFGLVALGVAGVIGVTVTLKTLPRLARLLGVKSERDLVADWLRPRLDSDEVIRALLASGVVDDAPGWAGMIPIMGGDSGTVVTLSEFLDSTCSLALTDRRLLLVLKRPVHEPDVRAYPIDGVLATGLQLGRSRIRLTLHPSGEAPVTVVFALDTESKRDAEIIAKALEVPR